MTISIISAQHERVVDNRDADPALTSVQNDDLILTFAFSNDDTASHTWDTGVTELESLQSATGQDTTVGFAWKKASSEGSTQNIDFADQTSITNTGAILILRGQDLTTPFDVTYVQGSHLIKETNEASPTVPAITTVTNGAVVVAVQFTPADGISDMVVPSSGASWTERDENTQSGSSFIISTATIAAFGTVTPGSSSHVGLQATDETVSFILAIRPVAVVGGLPGGHSMSRGISRGMSRGMS